MVFRDGAVSGRAGGLVAGLLLAAGLLCGCRPKDPLEWTVEAENLNAYNRWVSEHAADLGASLQAEFAAATHGLARMTPGFRLPENARDLANENNPFCRRVNGRTVREILIAYYMAANEHTMGSISLNLDAMTKLYQQISEAENARAERTIPYYKAQIEADRERIRRNDERLKELRAGTFK